MAVVLAPAIGPTLGGWITDNYDWRWIFFINVPIAIVSLILTSRMVEDPPHIQKEVAASRKRGLNLDYMGFGLLAVGFGSLQFVLDKGQENDWFGSHVITTFFVMCAASLVILIFWEIAQIRRGHRPILDLTMFRNRNFSISFLLMFVLGFTLFGTTVLIPLFVQQMMGYTAEQAGLVISPGGIAILCLMPMVGFLVSRVDARYLIAFGFAILASALAALHTIDTQASYSYVAWMRIFQASGLAFLFVPINTLSYTDIPRNKNNDVSGLMNLARNIGGSCGTSFFVTMLARRAQFHQDRLAMHMTGASNALRRSTNSLTPYFQHGGHSLAGARAMAQGTLYQQLIRQSTQLAYLDVIAALAIGAACMIPLIFFMKGRKGGPAAAH
jgi:DHA2 family multidrug resistance protein